MDLALVIALGTPAVGLALAALYGWQRAREKSKGIWLEALGLAIVLGIFLCIVQALLNEGCRYIKWCPDRGDVNLGYFFQSFFAIPLFWAVAGAVWEAKR